MKYGSGKGPRVPLVGTLELLTEELTRLANELGEVLPGPNQTVPLGAIRRPAKQQGPALTEALILLTRALPLLMAGLDKHHTRMNIRSSDLATSKLDDLDEAEVRYPRMEGVEGLARLIEHGAVIGPLLGAHLAAVLRKEKKLKTSNTSFEDGRYRRFAVKQLATIMHLWGVGLPKAVLMFCEIWDPDDPNATAADRVTNWVKRDRRSAKERLETSLSEQDHRHFKNILEGLHPEVPRGFLSGEKYPDALRELPPKLGQLLKS